jgi:hypothetical protein
MGQPHLYVFHDKFREQILCLNFHNVAMNLANLRMGVFQLIMVNIMANQKIFSLSIVLATAATGLFVGSASVSAAKLCGTKAECACQMALEIGSKNALRKFMRLYPRSNTACNALASTANVDAGGIYPALHLGAENPPSSVVPTTPVTDPGGDNCDHHESHNHHGEHGHHGDHNNDYGEN